MIYIVRSKGDPTAPIKIGYSKQPATRLAKLQIGNPLPLEIFSLLKGGVSEESALHRHLAMYATESNEWFYPCPEVRSMLRYIESEKPATAREVISKIVSGFFRFTS